jgi:hypothetical protein
VSGISFKAWLRRTKVTPDAAGDFIADARRDRDLPRGLKDPARLKQHLWGQGACENAVEAAEAAWRRYREETA